MKEKEIVEKVLISLPMIYNPNISILEDREDLDKITMEKLYGILVAYEMRIGKENSQKKEANFKESKVTKKYKTKIQSEGSDDEETLLVKNIMRGTSKYKEKLKPSRGVKPSLGVGSSKTHAGRLRFFFCRLQLELGFRAPACAHPG